MSTDKTNASKIHPTVMEVSDHTFKAMKVAKDGSATGHEDLYADHLKRHGKTIEEVNAIHNLDATFIAGTSHGVLRHTEAAYAKHKDLSEISVTVPMALNGRNKLSIATEREHTYATPGRDGQPAGTVTKHNDATIKYQTVEANFSAGQLKEVKLERNASAREALGGVKA